MDSLIGKLRALFNESGRRGEWDPRLLIGNPATDISLKQYLKAVTAEQLQAQITPTQATPVFVHDLVRLSHFLDEKLLSDKLSSIEMFVLMRDKASFKTLFFSGDRAGDLGQVKTPGNPPFPHIWGKPSVMARPTFLAYAVVSIQTFDLYVAFAKRIGIDLTGGFLFRPTSSDGTVIDKPFSSSAADARLKHYLREGEIGRAVSLHSFRSACAITLALSGTELQDIMGHVSWHNRSTAAYYMQLSQVMPAGSPSSVLTGQTVNIEDPGIFYDQCNNLRRFTPAFPR